MTASPVIATHRSADVGLRNASSGLALFVIGIALLAVSSNEYQIFYQIHASMGERLVETSHGVLSGHPPWKAFQARLLGPLALGGFEAGVAWLQLHFPRFHAGFERVFAQRDARNLVALDAFTATMILVKNVVLFGLLSRYTGSLAKAVAGTLLGSVLFIVLSDYWLYTWDMFELVFFSFLAFMMFSGKRLGAGFLLVYVLTLFNRESAAFFGVWLLCHAAARRLLDGQVFWREALAGVALIAVAVLYVTTLRDYLLVESTFGHETSRTAAASLIPAEESGSLHQALGNHLLIAENGLRFLKNLVSSHFYNDIYVVAVASQAVLVLRFGLRRRQARFVAIGAFDLFLLASILNFALLNETRLFLICIPFVVFSAVTFSREILAFGGRFDRRSAPTE